MRLVYSKPKTIDNILTEEEIEKLKKSARGLREKFVVYMLLYSGMRISELVHMRRDWVDFRRGIIYIPKEQPCRCSPSCRKPLFNRKGEMTKPPNTWKPKTSASVRAIPIVPEIEDVLTKFFSKYRSVMDCIPSRGSAHYILRKVARRAGINHPVFPHALRGTYATTLAAKGFTPFEIRDALGWKTIEPATHYIRLAGERLKKAFEEKW